MFDLLNPDVANVANSILAGSAVTWRSSNEIFS
jgi:hypothetical protein